MTKSQRQGPEPLRQLGVRAIVLLLGVSTLCPSCISTLKEEYYLKSFDPEMQVTNYFRIRVSGEIWLSTAKYSIGFYDRAAVETLFGERSLRQEYLIARATAGDLESRQQLGQLSENLAAAQTSLDKLRRENLLRALGAAEGLLERYRLRIASHPGNASSAFQGSLLKANASVAAAKTALDKASPDLAVATGELETAQVILEAIRIAVEAQLLVRFFDGAGNELPVRDKTLVIFVATDVSRFAQALGQLAESEEAKQNLLLAILGPRLQEAERLAGRVKASDTEEKILGDQLTALLQEIEGQDGDELAKSIAKAAAVASGRDGSFSSADEIRGYAEAMEPIR